MKIYLQLNRIQRMMKKNNNIDRKSNFNTSCASDLHSSMLSSIYGQTNINESLQKINQLKDLFMQTCDEEIKLDDQKNVLLQQLQSSKAKLQFLIAQKFGNQRSAHRTIGNILENQNIKDKPLLRPGCINKVNSKTINKEYKQIPKYEEFEQDKIFKTNSQLYVNDNCSRQDTNSNTKRISNLGSDYDQLLKQKQKQSVKYYQKKSQRNSNIDKCQSQLLKIWDGSKFQYGDQQKTKIRKSYLSSPRKSLLHSPRNYLE